MKYFYEEDVIISIIVGGGRVATDAAATAAAAVSYCNICDYPHQIKKSKEEEEGHRCEGESLDIDHGCMGGGSFLGACWTIYCLFGTIYNQDTHPRIDNMTVAFWR